MTNARHQKGKPRRATGGRQPETAGHATDARVEQGLEVAPVSNRRNDEEARKGGDTWKAARAGKALEGSASVGRPRTA
jgi:hypothetical protein